MSNWLNPSMPYRQTLWKPLRHRWKGLLAGALVTCGIAAVGLAEPQLVRYIVDTLIPAGMDSRWLLLIGLWTGLVLVRILLRFARVHILRHVTQENGAYLRSRLFAQLLRGSPDEMASRRTQDLSMTLTKDVEDLEPLWAEYPLAIVWYGVTAAGALIFSLTISWILTAVLAISVVLVTLLGRGVAKASLPAAHGIRKELDSIGIFTERSLASHRILQLYPAAGMVARRFDGHVHRLKSYHKSRANWKWLGAVTGELMELVTMTSVVVLGGLLVSRNAITLGALFSFVLYIDLLGTAFRKLVGTLEVMAKGVTAAGRIEEILGIERQPALSATARSAPGDIGVVELREVGYAYQATDTVFRGATWRLKRGHVHLLTGSNGVGKSTLIDILSGYRRPTEGILLVDGKPLVPNDIPHYWSSVSVLTQEELVFDDTVAFNLRLAASDVPDHDLAERLVEVGLAHSKSAAMEFLKKDAINLSLGQKRRLAIARAFVRNSDLYLFDEPTANLDENACEVLRRMTEERKHTAIFVIATQDRDRFPMASTCRELLCDGLRPINVMAEPAAAQG